MNADPSDLDMSVEAAQRFAIRALSIQPYVQVAVAFSTGERRLGWRAVSGEQVIYATGPGFTGNPR